MKPSLRSRILRSVVVCICSSIVVVLFAYILFSSGFDLATAGFSILILIVLLSLVARFFDSVILSFVAVGCLNYFFAPPIFSFQVANIEDTVVVAAFLTTTIEACALRARGDSGRADRFDCP
jgi:K+-sensing histidine kinase KdpD